MIPGLVGSRFQAEAFRAMVEQTEVEFEGFFAPLKRWFSVRITPTAEGSSPAPGTSPAGARRGAC